MLAPEVVDCPGEGLVRVREVMPNVVELASVEPQRDRQGEADEQDQGREHILRKDNEGVSG